MLKKSFLLLFSCTLLAQATGSQFHPRYISEKRPGQGKLWLDLPPERRLGFVEGYTFAYHKAHHQACLFAYDLNPGPPLKLGDKSLLQQCNDTDLQFSKSLEYYESQITSFYEKYPTDIDVPLAWLFQALSDSEHKSLEEIHQAWKNHTHP